MSAEKISRLDYNLYIASMSLYVQLATYITAMQTQTILATLKSPIVDSLKCTIICTLYCTLYSNLEHRQIFSPTSQMELLGVQVEKR